MKQKFEFIFSPTASRIGMKELWNFITYYIIICGKSFELKKNSCGQNKFYHSVYWFFYLYCSAVSHEKYFYFSLYSLVFLVKIAENSWLKIALYMVLCICSYDMIFSLLQNTVAYLHDSR